MEPTTGHRPLDDVPSQASPGSPRDLRPMARWTVLALVLWAIIDVLRTIVAVGHYEDRITIVTHGNPEVLPAWMAYQLLDELMPRATVNALADRAWIAGALVAAAAVIAWLHRARPGHAPASALLMPYRAMRDVQRASGPAARSASVSSWWAIVLATVLVHGLGRLYLTVTADGGIFEKTTLDTRWVAYPLWTSMTVMTVLTATRTTRLVRRITQARTAEPR